MSRAPIAAFPVGLRLEGRDVLVVGAGRIAARKAAALAEQGARLNVVALHYSADMDALDVATREVRSFHPSDLDDVWYVVTATGDPAVDGLVFAEAEKRRVFCNAADDPDHCSVILPAVVRRGAVTISISTGGRSPATASWLRRQIGELLDDDVDRVADVAASVRDRMRDAGLATEVPGWAAVLDGEAKTILAGSDDVELERRLWEALVEA
ncbi:MAG: bifunctional precorrin-2 dehydrogenase/sirohydrochlorin ferrochelatase [Acidimicrobiales bacterium]